MLKKAVNGMRRKEKVMAQLSATEKSISNAILLTDKKALMKVLF
jgi:hypothetical protein